MKKYIALVLVFSALFVFTPIAKAYTLDDLVQQVNNLTDQVNSLKNQLSGLVIGPLETVVVSDTQITKITPVPPCYSDSPSSIKIISPNGGEVYEAGGPLTITWRGCNLSDRSFIRIALYSPSINMPFEFDAQGANGSKTVTLPTKNQWADMIYGKNFKIHVFNVLAKGSLVPMEDYSDDLFTINTPTYHPSWVNVGTPGFSQGPAYDTSLVLDSSNTPYIAYSDWTTPGFSKVIVKKFNGTSWVNVGTEVASTTGSASVSLTLDSNNVPYVAYQDSLKDGQKVTVKKFNGTSWVNVGTPEFSQNMAFSIKLALDSNNIPYVAYSDDSNQKEKVIVKKFNGTSWVNVGTEVVSTGGSYTISFILDSNNIPYVAYYNYDNKITVKKFNGTSWVNVGVTGFLTTYNGLSNTVSLALDSNNVPYLAYADYLNGNKETVKKFNGTSWVNVGISGFSANTIEDSSLSFDSNNSPYVAYQDFVNGQKTTVMKFNSTSWVNVGLPIFTVGKANYISLVLDSSNVPYVAYQDGANSLKATVMKFK